MREIKLAQHKHWVAFAITGLITLPSESPNHHGLLTVYTDRRIYVWREDRSDLIHQRLAEAERRHRRREN